MARNAMGSGRFRFGLFEFDAAKLEVRREGVLLRLQTQPALALACLIERADEVVSREELRKAVWGEKTFVDFEGGLNFCISQIRSALQDDAAQPVYVRTVPRSGYQFMAPVERIAEQAEETTHPAREPRKTPAWVWVAAAGAVLVIAAIGAMGLLMYLYLTPSGKYLPILAVARFDNETGDAGTTKFSDALTDNVVEQLTVQSGGNFGVIGNAQILRLPREQRDLKAIATSLHAQYVILGQVQTNGTRVRILAHLIRLSDQTHIWVVRLDRPLNDPLNVESEAAQRIATEFSARMAARPDQAGSFEPTSH